ncbi:nuclear transport factor 2 family protein [Microbacterium sp.]|uniref:nuclear transport factor 2 family protein n=1 Tax=Microbacterium sp. TaxID=51671 RepID=UPI0028116A1F|nr:nuclear transport factor 2 family protein [Microbacterium sp.]
MTFPSDSDATAPADRTDATTALMHRFNRAFTEHDATGFDDLIADDCVMEAVAPAPEGERTVGKAACLAFWKDLIENPSIQFTPERIDAFGEAAIIRWRLVAGSGPGHQMRGVNLMRVREGRIVEALGYGKVPGAERSATTP